MLISFGAFYFPLHFVVLIFSLFYCWVSTECPLRFQYVTFISFLRCPSVLHWPDRRKEKTRNIYDWQLQLNMKFIAEDQRHLSLSRLNFYCFFLLSLRSWALLRLVCVCVCVCLSSMHSSQTVTKFYLCNANAVSHLKQMFLFCFPWKLFSIRRLDDAWTSGVFGRIFFFHQITQYEIRFSGRFTDAFIFSFELLFFSLVLSSSRRNFNNAWHIVDG